MHIFPPEQVRLDELNNLWVSESSVVHKQPGGLRDPARATTLLKALRPGSVIDVKCNDTRLKERPVVYDGPVKRDKPLRKRRVTVVIDVPGGQ